MCEILLLFFGQLLEAQSYGLVIRFTSVHNSESWTLVTVYGPCQDQLRDDFAYWLYHLHIPVDDKWLFLGDFNFIRSLDNRNRPGGDINDIFSFNEIIGHLGLLELPLKGRAFTWSNMQEQPLLEQLDWFFLPLALGFHCTRILLFSCLLALPLIMCFVWFLLTLPSLSPRSLGLRTIGCICQASWTMLLILGQLHLVCWRFLLHLLLRLRYDLKRWCVNLSSIKNLIKNVL